MAGETVITVVGNLTADPEMSFTGSGVARVSFTIASTPRTFDRQANEWKDGDALFLRCTAWRTLAENISQSLTKGARVVAQGVLKQRSYEDREGQKRTAYELAVDEVGPSLVRATAQVSRNQSQGAQNAGFGGGSQQGWVQTPPAGSAPSTGGFGNMDDEQPF